MTIATGAATSIRRSVRVRPFAGANRLESHTREVETEDNHGAPLFDFPRCFQVATIICHSNCRADKTDLCLPEWVFEKIEAAGIRLQS